MINFKNSINILGSKWKIEIHKMSKDKYMKEKGYSGYCCFETKKIVIADLDEKEYFGDLSEEEKAVYARTILRHEIVHAFLDESGLCDNALQPNFAWSKNEEMVDWIALQGPKLYKAWIEVDAV